MKPTIIYGLVIGLSLSTAVGCGGNSNRQTSSSTLLADGEACAAAWNSTTIYNVAGAKVSRSGRNYTSAYWTQGNDPATSNGPAGSGQPWITGYLCGGSPAPAPAPAPAPTPTPAPAPAPTPTPAGSCPQYVNGATYATSAKVTNGGGFYQCTVGGWCSQGGAYAPGSGWAWQNAWTQISSSQCGGSTPAPASTPTWITLLDGNQFSSNTALWANFNNGYPWGSDHNGSARMYKDNVWTDGMGALVLASWIVSPDEGNSDKDPYLPIHYHSGAVYWKQQVTVDSSATQWTLEGDFAVPSAYGTWPAFWLTAVNGWPPELDIMEFVGSATCRQNTFFGSYPNQSGVSHQTPISNPANFHHYKIALAKKNDTDVLVDYYIDGVRTAEDTATNYVGKPMWLILNLQMEGSAGAPAPNTNQYYYAKNLVVRKYQ